MANLLRITDAGGLRFGCQTRKPDGTRRTIGIGRASERDAERFCANVSELERARTEGRSPDSDTARWIARLPDRVHGALADAGLVTRRQAPAAPPAAVPTLEAWVDRLMDQRRADQTDRTREIYGRVRDRLVKHFGAGRPLDWFTPAHAADWRAALARDGKGESTVRMYARTVKAFFNAATDQEVIGRNPFAKLPSASIAAEREHHVSAADAAKVLAALPPGQHRVIFALARLAGLRVPSETRGLRWADVSWETNRLSVYAPKTKTRRVVPLGPELVAILQDAFDAAPPGAEFIAPLASAGSLAGVMRSAIRRAGLIPWPKLMQACRQACETDWLDRFPSHVAAAWLGHSALVQAKHYAQVTDAHYAAASSAPRHTPAAPYAFGMPHRNAPGRTEQPNNHVGATVRADALVCAGDNPSYESPALYR